MRPGQGGVHPNLSLWWQVGCLFQRAETQIEDRLVPGRGRIDRRAAIAAEGLNALRAAVGGLLIGLERAAQQAEILNLIAKLRQRYSLTSILVSHDLAVVAHLCNRIAIMQLGRLVEIITAADLRSGAVKTDYTRRLIAASRGFTRAPA